MLSLAGANSSSTGSSSSSGIAIKWSFVETAANTWELESSSPQSSNLGPTGFPDPTLNLVVGARYTVTVDGNANDPFELIAKGANASDDVVLLAQPTPTSTVPGTFQDDPGVDLVADPAHNTFSFTLTPALADAMSDPTQGLSPGYRSGNSDLMGLQRGDLVLTPGTAVAVDTVVLLTGVPRTDVVLAPGPTSPKGTSPDGSGSADLADVSLSASGSGSASGTLGTAGAVQFYRVAAPVTGSLTITQAAAPGSSLEGILLVDDSSGHQIGVNAARGAGQTSRVTVPVVAGATYFVEVAGDLDSTGAYALSLATAPVGIVPPGTLAGAQVVTLDARGSGSWSGTIANPGQKDDYVFVAPVTGTMTVTQVGQSTAPTDSAPLAGNALSGALLTSTLDHELDSLVSVYNQAGQLIAANDDSGGTLNSRVAIPVVAGMTYRIRAAGFLMSTGAYQLSVTTQPEASTVATALPLALSPDGLGTAAGTIHGPGEGEYVRFVAPVSGTMTVVEQAAPGSGLLPSIAAFDAAGNPLPGSTATTPGRIQLTVTAGQTYILRAGARGDSTGAFRLDLEANDPANTLATATPIALSPAGFAQQAGILGVPGDAHFDQFVAPFTGTLVITQDAAQGGALDSVLSVYTVRGSQPPTLLASNDDGGGGRNSMLRLQVVRNQTYVVEAAGFPTSVGPYVLTLIADPTNQTPGTARPVALDATGTGQADGTVASAGESVLYTVTPSASGPLTLRVSPAGDSGFDPILRVYNAQGTLLATDDDSGGGTDSLVTLKAVAGTTYLLSISGFQGSTGAFHLKATSSGQAALGAATPAPVSLGLDPAGNQSGSLDAAGARDVYIWTAPASGELTVVVTPEAGSSLLASLHILDVTEGAGDGSGSGTDVTATDRGQGYARVEVPVVGGVTYQFQVAGVQGSTGRYALQFLLNDPSGGSLLGAPSGSLTIAPGSHSTQQDGDLHLAGDSDAFQFTAPMTGRLVVDLSDPPDGRLVGSLQVRGGGIAASSQAAAGPNGDRRLELNVIQGQTYQVTVSGVDASTGGFHLTLALFPTPTNGFGITDLAQGPTPTDLVNALLGPDNSTIQVVPGSVVYQGAADASGLFSGGAGLLDSRDSGSNPFTGGVVLATGSTSSLAGLNIGAGPIGLENLAGSTALDQLLQQPTVDASVLFFQFIPTDNVVQLSYVLTAEQLQDIEGSFSDAFGVFINGVDYARVPGTGTTAPGTGVVVSASTINAGANAQDFVDNSFAAGGGFGHLDIALNGLTRVLTIRAPVHAGQVNTISLAIADTAGSHNFSAAFLKAGSFSAVREALTQHVGQVMTAQLDQAAAAVRALGPAPASDQTALLLQEIMTATCWKLSGLVGDNLIVVIDPVDFTLTTASGQSVTANTSGNVVSDINNVFYSSNGVTSLLIIPDATPGSVRVELTGVGSGDYTFGASYVSGTSGATSVLLAGNLAPGQSSLAVLDFQDLNGSTQEGTLSVGAPGTVVTAAANSVAASGSAAPAASSPESVATTSALLVSILGQTQNVLGTLLSTTTLASAAAPNGATTGALPNQSAARGNGNPAAAVDNENRPLAGAQDLLASLLDAIEVELGSSPWGKGLLELDWESLVTDLLHALRPGPAGSSALLDLLQQLLQRPGKATASPAQPPAPAGTAPAAETPGAWLGPVDPGLLDIPLRDSPGPAVDRLAVRLEADRPRERAAVPAPAALAFLVAGASHAAWGRRRPGTEKRGSSGEWVVGSG